MTQTDNDGNGSSMTGLFAGANSYQALCNGTPIAQLIPSFGVAPPFLTNTSSGNFGPTNFNATSMQAEWDFTLSANDSASATSVYSKTLVPSPASGLLLGIAGVAVRRRRR
jgi:hypothetical protein